MALENTQTTITTTKQTYNQTAKQLQSYMVVCW